MYDSASLFASSDEIHFVKAPFQQEPNWQRLGQEWLDDSNEFNQYSLFVGCDLATRDTIFVWPEYQSISSYESDVPLPVSNTLQCSKCRGFYSIRLIDKSQGYSSFAGWLLRDGVLYEFASSSEEFEFESWSISDMIYGYPFINE